jgi:tRNA pseudouridine38-40 synthase
VPQIKLIVEYNGAGFAGWQKQPNQRTVQEVLEQALTVICRQPVGPLHAAGRTDSGVHARGQVVTFFVQDPPAMFKIMAGVSHLMKGELAVLSAEICSEDFHPGHDCTHKQYSYRIMNRPAPPVLDSHQMWHIGTPTLDVEEMRRQAQALVGTHDFSGFRDSECAAKTPIKTIYALSVTEDRGLITITVIGSGFLKQMVRNIVGTLVDLVRGRLDGRTVQEILDRKDRRLAGMTAPAHGLTMDWISYDPLPKSFRVE